MAARGACLVRLSSLNARQCNFNCIFRFVFCDWSHIPRAHAYSTALTAALGWTCNNSTVALWQQQQQQHSHALAAHPAAAQKRFGCTCCSQTAAFRLHLLQQHSNASAGAALQKRLLQQHSSASAAPAAAAQLHLGSTYNSITAAPRSHLQ